MGKKTHISVEPSGPIEIKTRIPVWLYPSTLEVMDRAMKIANSKSRSEYLEKATLLYADYVSGQDATAYLPPALASVLRGTVQGTENHICRLLFKLAVEQDMVMNVLAAGIEIPDEQLRTRRSWSIQDVKKPAAVSRWTMPSAIKEAVYDHPSPTQILRRKTKNKGPEKVAAIPTKVWYVLVLQRR